MDNENKPGGPVITPNGNPQNREAPGGPGFPKGPEINWEPRNESSLPPTWKPGTGNEMPNKNEQNQ